MKRFYREAAIADLGDAFGVALDGRKVKTPAGRGLAVPSSALAEALAQEWHAQGEQILPATMKLTQLVSTALDRVAVEPAKTLDYVGGFGETDLLCYRATHPADLVRRQQLAWQPLLDWAAENLRVELVVTAGVVPVRQPEAALTRLRQRLEGYDFWTMSALLSLVPAFGSVILGLAVIEGRLAALDAFELAKLDDDFQVERWGSDREAVQRQEGLRQEIAAAAQYLTLLRA
jgi:chaperone required for assembly of F1-ATPase